MKSKNPNSDYQLVFCILIVSLCSLSCFQDYIPATSVDENEISNGLGGDGQAFNNKSTTCTTRLLLRCIEKSRPAMQLNQNSLSDYPT